MQERDPLLEGPRTIDRGLAEAFDELCRLREARQQAYVITYHAERPEAFKWFIEGVMYERARKESSKLTAQQSSD
jgi:hypothetical protein